MAKLEEVTWPQPEAEFVRRDVRALRRAPPLGVGAQRPPEVDRARDARGLRGLRRLRAPLRHPAQRGPPAALPRRGATRRSSAPCPTREDRRAPRRARLPARARPHTDASLLEEWEAEGRRPAQRSAGRDCASASTSAHAQGVSSSRPHRAAVSRPRPRPRRLRGGGALGATGPEADPWDAARFAAALAPFLAAHERVAFDPAARRADQTVLKSIAPLVFRVQHVLPDPAGEGTGYLEGEIDLRGGAAHADSALVRLLGIHP